MYNIMHEKMVEGTLLRAVTGSIFEAENNAADGVAIFVMCGLTGFRPNTRDYVSTLGDSIGCHEGLTMFSKRTEHGDILFIYDENPDNKIYELNEMYDLVDKTLELFAGNGVRRIAMNGIRITPENTQEHLAEKHLVAFVRSWCAAHKGVFETIDFVDKRGGFDGLGFPGKTVGFVEFPSCVDSSLDLIRIWAQRYVGYRKLLEHKYEEAVALLCKVVKEGEMLQENSSEMRNICAEAQYGLGWMYERGAGVDSDLVEAAKWYRKAAENGFDIAQCELGRCYECGRGVQKSITEAASWFRKAADRGNPFARERLVKYYIGSAGAERNPEEVEKLLKSARGEG